MLLKSVSPNHLRWADVVALYHSKGIIHLVKSFIAGWLLDVREYVCCDVISCAIEQTNKDT